QENDDGAADRQQPGAQIEELLQTAAEDHAADPANEKRADDTQQKRDDPAAALLARQDQLGDRAGDEAEKKESEEAHESLRSLCITAGCRVCTQECTTRGKSGNPLWVRRAMHYMPRRTCRTPLPGGERRS